MFRIKMNKITIILFGLLLLIEFKLINSQYYNYRNHKYNNYNRNSDSLVFSGNSDDIQKRESDNYDSGCTTCNTNYEDSGSGVIPRDVIDKFLQVENLDEFIEMFLANETIDMDDPLYMGAKKDYDERSGNNSPKPATCIPTPQIVSTIPDTKNDDPSILYYPTCTRVNRCGGCCSVKSYLLSCQPTEKVARAFVVKKTKYRNNKLQIVGNEIVSVDEHLACTCMCTIKESDCNSLQKYNKSECSCKCQNAEEERKCKADPSGVKIWDPSTCQCRCRETKECTTGVLQDPYTCECTAYITSRVGLDPADRKKFIVQAQPIN